MSECPVCKNRISVFRGLNKIPREKKTDILKTSRDQFSCNSCGSILQKREKPFLMSLPVLAFPLYWLITRYIFEDKAIVGTVVLAFALFTFVLSILSVTYEESN